MEYQNENFNGQYDFRSRYHDGWQMVANLHEYSELLYCKSGCGYVTVGGRRILLSAGELVFIPPNYIHQYDFDGAEVICAVFSNDFIPLFFRKVQNRFFHVSAVPMGELCPLIETLPAKQKGDALTVCGLLNLICARVMERARLDEQIPQDGVLYQKVITYLAENFKQDITLSAVAHRFGYNTKYLSHALHTLTGIHFRCLLNFYRLNHAKGLLQREKVMSIATVSAESGFRSLNTFNREFKSMTGLTPKEYRRTYLP